MNSATDVATWGVTMRPPFPGTSETPIGIARAVLVTIPADTGDYTRIAVSLEPNHGNGTEGVTS